jgi:hypothetical protein
MSTDLEWQMSLPFPCFSSWVKQLGQHSYLYIFFAAAAASFAALSGVSISDSEVELSYFSLSMGLDAS